MGKRKNDQIGKVILIGGVGLLALFLLKGKTAQAETGTGGTPYANEDLAGLLNAIKETPPSVSFPSSSFTFPTDPNAGLIGGSTGDSLTTSKKESELINQALSPQPSYLTPLSPYKPSYNGWFNVNTSWKDTNSSMLDTNNTVDQVFGDLSQYVNKNNNYTVDLTGSNKTGIQNTLTTSKKEVNTSQTDSPYYQISTTNPKPVYLDSKKSANLMDTRNYTYDGYNISINAGEVTTCQGGKCPI
jgi:hypothetical protein